MISVLALDSATLAMTTELSALRLSAESSDRAVALFEAATGSEPKSCEALLTTESSDSARRVLASFCSSVWHEKRHFLDLLLTNYGAFRLRQFFQVYIGAGPLLSDAVDSKRPIFCPIDAYADKCRSAAHGLTTWGRAESIGGALRAAKRVIASDQEPIQLRPGLSASIGGDAQLEALAYTTQLIGAQHFLGVEGGRAVQQQVKGMPGHHSRYFWATDLGMQTGLLKRLGLTELEVEVQTWDFLFPLIFASLMMRSYGQDQSKSGAVLPSNRLALLCTEAAKEKSLVDLSCEQSWNWINDASKRLWGRTIIQELQHDLEREDDWVTQVQADDSVLVPVKTILREYHKIRRQLAALLIQTPLAVIDPLVSSLETIPTLQPYLILYNSAGYLGPTPEGYDRVFGFRDPRLDTKTDPQQNYKRLELLGQWTWALTSNTPPQGKYAFREHEAWLAIFTEFAPLAKLLLNGRVHKTAPGPELVFAENYLRANLKVKFEFDPTFRVPRYDTLNAAKYIGLLRDGKPGLCDGCSTELVDAQFFVIPPWFFRISGETFDRLVQAYGDGGEGQLAAWRDWSMWIVCSHCFSNFMEGDEGREAWSLVSSVPLTLMPTSQSRRLEKPR